MNCDDCGHKLQEKSVFCGNCGKTALPWVMPMKITAVIEIVQFGLFFLLFFIFALLEGSVGYIFGVSYLGFVLFVAFAIHRNCTKVEYSYFLYKLSVIHLISRLIIPVIIILIIPTDSEFMTEIERQFMQDMNELGLRFNFIGLFIFLYAFELVIPFIYVFGNHKHKEILNKLNIQS